MYFSIAPPVLLVGVFGIGLPEFVIVSALLLLFFGAKKLPLLARGIANIPNQFRKGRSDEDSKPPGQR